MRLARWASRTVAGWALVAPFTLWAADTPVIVKVSLEVRPEDLTPISGTSPELIITCATNRQVYLYPGAISGRSAALDPSHVTFPVQVTLTVPSSAERIWAFAFLDRNGDFKCRGNEPFDVLPAFVSSPESLCSLQVHSTADWGTEWGLSPDSVALAWSTGALVQASLPRQATAEIEWRAGEASSPEVRRSSSAAVRHRFTLGGLPPSEECHYVIRGVDDDGQCHPVASGEFQTAPANAQSAIRVAFLGDSMNGFDTFAEITSELAAHHPQLVVHLGDIFWGDHDGSAANSLLQLRGTFDCLAPLLGGCSFVPVPGNHDRPLSLHESIWPLPGPDSDFALPWGPITIIGFDDTSGAPTPERLAWLETALSEAGQTSAFTIVAVHIPVMAAGHADPSQGALAAALARHRVDLTFAGHFHGYERNLDADIPQVVSGGAGSALSSPSWEVPHLLKFHHFCLLEADGHHARVSVYELGGALRDRFTLDRLIPTGVVLQ